MNPKKYSRRLLSTLAGCCCIFAMHGAPKACGAVTFVDVEPDMRTNILNVEFNVDIDGNGFRDVWFVQTTGTSGLTARSTPLVRIQSTPTGDPGTVDVFPIPEGSVISETPVASSQWIFSPSPFHHGISSVVLIGSTLVNYGLFPGHDAFMGIEMTLPDGIHYGYIRLEVGSFSTLGIIKSYAFETMPGVPIIAGSVPEPGRTGLILGALLAALLVRRRAVAAASRARRT